MGFGFGLFSQPNSNENIRSGSAKISSNNKGDSLSKYFSNGSKEELDVCVAWDNNGNIVGSEVLTWNDKIDEDGEFEDDYSLEAKNFDELSSEEQEELLKELEDYQNQCDCYVDMYGYTDDNDDNNNYFSNISLISSI